MLRKFIAAVLSVLLVSCTGSQLYKSDADKGKYIIGYLFPQDKLIVGDDIAVEKLTHINYAFADIRDGEIAQGFKNDVENFRILSQAKKRNPHLKILISVGGWTWSGRFSDMCLTKESRAKFINSGIQFIQKSNLDGIDIDWEFPGLVGYGNIHRPEDKENFTYFLQEMHSALEELGAKNSKHYLLTIATGAFDDYLANTEMDKVQKYVDFVNVMTYDFCEPDPDTIAGHHTPLYTNPRDPHLSSADAMIQKYIAAGVMPEKLVLGVAFYGRTWQVTSSDYHGLYEPGGPPKKRFRGSFNNLVPNLINKNGFVRYWDSTSYAPYLFNVNEKIFITYDDEESLKAKCQYINKYRLKGAMFWEYTSDYQSRLLQTLFDGLK
jgi:chitinase